MPESFVQVPPQSTGKKLRTRARTIGADTVEEQAVFLAAPATYYALADSVTFANGKVHFSIENAAGSGVVVAVRKVFAINKQISAVTGAALEMRANRIASHSAGTLITPVTADTDNAALPAQVTVRTGGTVTTPVAVYPFIVTTEEETATAALTKNMFMAASNLQPECSEIQELRLREGQGFCITQITNATVGNYAWLMVFTVLDE